MKCLKESCSGNYKESPHNKFTGYNSYKCNQCNHLVDEKEIKKTKKQECDSPYTKRENETEQEYKQRMMIIMPYF